MNRLLIILFCALSACNNSEGSSNFLKSLKPGSDLFAPSQNTQPSSKKTGVIKSIIKPSKEDIVSEENSINDCPKGTTRAGKGYPRGNKQWCFYKDEDGKEIKHGEFRQWNNNGSIALKCTYADNELEGDLITSYPDGEIKEKTNYVHGRKEGVSTYYNKDGSKKLEANYRQDLLNGLYTEYGRNGAILMKGSFLNDQRNGLWEDYDQRGNLKIKSEYKDGVKHGKAILYNRTGSPSAQGMFSQDTEIGHWIFYNNEGQKKTEGNFVDGKKHGRWVDYNKNSQPIRNTYFDMGRKGESYAISTKVGSDGRVGGFGKGDILGEEPLPVQKNSYSTNTYEEKRSKKRDNKPAPLEKEGWSAL